MIFHVLSDNYFYCEGIRSSHTSVHFVPTSDAISRFYDAFSGNNLLIIAIENMYLRNETIERCHCAKAKYIVLLEDMIKNDWFVIDNVIYSSLSSSQQHLRKIISAPEMNRRERLTPRELNVLPHVHLSNMRMASLLNLSHKTASGYKVIIKRKLKMKAYNALALTRVKNAIMCSEPDVQNMTVS